MKVILVGSIEELNATSGFINPALDIVGVISPSATADNQTVNYRDKNVVAVPYNDAAKYLAKTDCDYILTCNDKYYNDMNITRGGGETSKVYYQHRIPA